MIIELITVLSIIAFVSLLIIYRDVKYLIAFGIGLFVAFSIEPLGILINKWSYWSIAWPFNILILGVPLAIYLLYACTAGAALFATRAIYKLVKKYETQYDKKLAYFLIIIGIPFSILANLIDIPLYLGLAFIMVGLYLFVKDPVIFYVGLIAMAADFVFEKLFMLSNQYGYTVAYGETGVCWFLGAASIAAIFLLLDKKTKS